MIDGKHGGRLGILVKLIGHAVHKIADLLLSFVQGLLIAFVGNSADNWNKNNANDDKQRQISDQICCKRSFEQKYSLLLFQRIPEGSALNGHKYNADSQKPQQ